MRKSRSRSEHWEDQQDLAERSAEGELHLGFGAQTEEEIGGIGAEVVKTVSAMVCFWAGVSSQHGLNRKRAVLFIPDEA